MSLTKEELKAIELRTTGLMQTECYKAVYDTEGLTTRQIQSKSGAFFRRVEIVEALKKLRREGEEARQGFTEKQLKAIALRVEGHTKTDCYKQAYDVEAMNENTIHTRAFELFEVPHIAAEVKRRKSEGFKEFHIELDEVLALMADSLKVDPADLFDETGALKAMHDIPKRTRLAMTSFEVVEMDGGLFRPDRTVTKVKFNPKSQIMDMFMKKFGDYAAKRLEVQDVTPISRMITDEEIERINKKLDERY